MTTMHARGIGVVVVALMFVGGITACSGSDTATGSKSDTATSDTAKSDTAKSDTATSDPGGSGDTRPAGTIADSDTGNADVDKFCDAVRDYVSAAQNLRATSSQSEIEKLGKQGAELSSQAAKLSAKAVRDPDLARDISECSAQLSSLSRGG